MLSSKLAWPLLARIFFCTLAVSVTAASAEEAVSGTTESTSESRCHEAAPVLQIPFRTCYIGESEVSKLVNQMEIVIGMLNSDQDYTESRHKKMKKIPELQEFDICSEKRIQLLADELRWVSRRLWELSIRLEEPKEAEVQLLDKRKVDLIRHLHNIHVFPGAHPSTMQLESFSMQVEFLEYGFNTALVMFQTHRPTRPVPVAPKAAIIGSILNPKNSISDLIELSSDQPTAMSEALPQLISDRYAGKLENVQLVLDFVKDLPNVVHQLIGYTSLHDAMSANADLESYQLTTLVLQLKGINATVTSASADIPSTVLKKYTQLVDDVWPVYQIIGKNTTYCDFRNLKYARGIGGWDYIISLYSAESSRSTWRFYAVSGTAMFTTNNGQWYSSESDVFSASKRSVKSRNPAVSELFAHWKLVPVKGGKYFRILNAKYDEVLFADKAEMHPSLTGYRRVFLARHDYPHLHEYEQDADLWTVDCKE